MALKKQQIKNLLKRHTLTTKNLGGQNLSGNILGEVIWAGFLGFGRDKFWAG